MGKVSQHLKTFHEHASEHHSTLHECYSKLAGGMEKAAKKDGVENAEDLTNCLKTIASTHEAASSFHKEMANACAKAAQASDLEKNQMLVPTQVSAVAPDVTQNIRAVIRTGAKPFPAQTHAAPLGGVDFSKIIGIEDLNEL
jgi:hypothetical protein